MSKNVKRKDKFEIGDFVFWDKMPEKKLEIIFKHNAENSSQQNIYKLRINLRTGKKTQTNWIPENQLTK